MSSTGGMGRGSDTRMYSPRSESSHMYSANEGEEKYNPVDPRYKEQEKEKKLREDDEKKQMRNKIKHIKILGHHGKNGVGEPETPNEADTDLDPRRDLQNELSRQTGPPGNRGHELDLATGAKTGTGSAMGSRVATGEPMDNAWSELLKFEGEDEFIAQQMEQQRRVEEAMENARKKTMEKETSVPCPSCGAQIGEPCKGLNPKLGYPSHKARMNLVQRSEPMDNAWSELLKDSARYVPEDNPEEPPKETVDLNRPRIDEMRPFAMMDNTELAEMMMQLESMNRHGLPEEAQAHIGDDLEDMFQSLLDEVRYRQSENVTDTDFYENQNPLDYNPVWQDKYTSEPMEGAWSELLKRETPKTMQRRRKKEQRAEFRPSTGQFKKPPGGQSGGPGSTMRRFKARMRGIKSGKKTGLMKPHLAVEMSHRGIKTKQPMSKDPARYRAYMGQQEAKKILGGARTVWSPHARYAERSTRAGPTGGGQLTGLAPGQAGQMRQPSLRRMRQPRMPRMRQPRMPRSMNPMGMPPMGGMSAVPPLPQAPPIQDPSQMMMSEDVISHSDLLKMHYADMAELRTLLRRIARAKEQEAKESKKKAGTTSATEGAMPSHPAGIHGDSDDEDPDGPTENDEMKANRLGLDPAGYLTSKRGHMG
jgi:hypothetical protein